MTTHTITATPATFDAIASGHQGFIVCKHDVGYGSDERVKLVNGGRWTYRMIEYVYVGAGVDDGYCVIGFKRY